MLRAFVAWHAQAAARGKGGLVDRAGMRGVVDIQLARLRALLEERKILLDITDDAKTWLADAGYDPAYGARPLKRTVQREIQNPLAGLLLEGAVREGGKVRVGVEDGGLSVLPSP